MNRSNAAGAGVRSHSSAARLPVKQSRAGCFDYHLPARYRCVHAVKEGLPIKYVTKKRNEVRNTLQARREKQNPVYVQTKAVRGNTIYGRGKRNHTCAEMNQTRVEMKQKGVKVKQTRVAGKQTHLFII